MIVKELQIAGDKGETRVRALFDTGAPESFIRKDVAKEVATMVRLRKPRKFWLGDGKASIESQMVSVIDFDVKGCSIFNQFMAVENLADDLIIGADALQRWKIRLDPENEEVLIDEKTIRLQLV